MEFLLKVCSKLYEECHQENRQLSQDISGVRLQLERVKHQLEIAAHVSFFFTFIFFKTYFTPGICDDPSL